MKTKIEIKSIFGQVLFEYEKVNNTIKDTVKEAIQCGTNLCDADLRGANLYGADLRGAYLYGANLRGANLCGADLYGANLSGANLCDANLSGAYLYGANLSGADLYGANLCGADLYGANLRGANLCDAKLFDADLWKWGKLSSPQDVLIVGTIGSRNAYTTIYHTDKGVFVQCGCFKGTLDEFITKVKETHSGTKHERDYIALVEFAKIKFEL